MSTQPDSRMDDLPQVNAADETQSAQNAWSNDRGSSASQTRSSFAPETCLRPATDSHTATHANQTTKLEDEEYGEFVQASTDPLKRPVYDTTDQKDETLGLLNSKSAPERQPDTYIGMGIVEPVYVSFNKATRRVKKMAHWKRNDTRANMIVAEWKRKKTHGVGVANVSDAAAAGAPVGAEFNQYLPVSRPTTLGSEMNGVMRPVRFAGSAIEEMVETERTAWEH